MPDPKRFHTPQWLLATIAIALFMFLLFRGLVPAFTEIGSDFPNYYTSARLALSGDVTEQLYDDVWFQRQIDSAGINQQGKFSPFPPPTALVAIPVALLEPLRALQVVSFVNVLLCIVAVRIFSRLFGFTLLESTVIILGSGWGLANCFRLGQLYIALAVCMLLAIHLQRNGKSQLAGLAAGILLPVKYFSAINIIDFLVRKDRRAVAAALATVATVCVLSIAVLGWEVHRAFVQTIFGSHLSSNLTQQNPFSTSFQSLDSLFRNLFIADSVLNPNPLVHSSSLFRFAKLSTTIAAILVAAIAIYRNRKQSHESLLPLAVLTTLGLFIAPATATYHFVLFWIPIGVLLSHFRERDEFSWMWFAGGLYLFLGFIPYTIFRAWSGPGIGVIFAYPRLLIVFALFLTSILACFRERS